MSKLNGIIYLSSFGNAIVIVVKACFPMRRENI